VERFLLKIDAVRYVHRILFLSADRQAAARLPLLEAGDWRLEAMRARPGPDRRVFSFVLRARALVLL